MSCVRCGYPYTQTHHRKLRRHKDERPVNLVQLCVRCHDFVHRNPASAYEQGLLVHSWDDPAEVPLRVVVVSQEEIYA